MNFVIGDWAVEYSDDEITYTNIKTNKTETISKNQFDTVLYKSSPMQLFFNGINVTLMRQIQMKVYEEKMKMLSEGQQVSESGEPLANIGSGIYKRLY